MLNNVTMTLKLYKQQKIIGYLAISKMDLHKSIYALIQRVQHCLDVEEIYFK